MSNINWDPTSNPMRNPQVRVLYAEASKVLPSPDIGLPLAQGIDKLFEVLIGGLGDLALKRSDPAAVQTDYMAQAFLASIMRAAEASKIDISDYLVINPRGHALAVTTFESAIRRDAGERLSAVMILAKARAAQTEMKGQNANT